MTNLIEAFLNLLFEKSPSPAAVKAHKLGLSSKGFGLWGPPDGDVVTHTSRGGPLRPVKQKDASRSQQTKQTGTQPTRSPAPVPRQQKPVQQRPTAPVRAAPRPTAKVKKSVLPPKQPLSRTAVTKDVIGGSEVIERGGKKYIVRRVIDERGKPIDISTEQGRRKAATVLEKRLERARNQITHAAKTFESRESKQFLGEIGELLTLQSVLAAGGEAYLLPGSTAEDDLLVFKEDKKRGLIVSEISVKSSLGDVVGAAGSNIRNIFKKAVGDKLMRYDDGKSHTGDRLADAVLDVNYELSKFLTMGTIEGKDRNVVIPEKLRSKFDSSYDPNQFQDKTGKLSSLLRARRFSAKDIDEFMQSASAKKLLQGPNGAAIHAVLNKLKSQLSTKTRANHLSSFVEQELSDILDATQSSFMYPSDLVAVKFNTDTGYDDSSVRIITAETMHKRAEERAKKANAKLVDRTGTTCFEPSGRMKGKCQLKILGAFSIRHRVLYSSQGYKNGYTGPIVNAAPPTSAVGASDRLSSAQWLATLNEMIQILSNSILLSETSPHYYERFKGVPPEILDRELTYNPIDPKTGRLRIDKNTGAPKVSKVKLSNVLFTPSKYEKYPALVNMAHQMAGPYLDKGKEEKPEEPEEPIAQPGLAAPSSVSTVPTQAPTGQVGPMAAQPPQKIKHVFPANHRVAIKHKFSIRFLKHLTPYKNDEATKKHLALLLLTVLLHFKKHKKHIIQKYFGNRDDLSVLKRLARQIVDTFPTNEKLLNATVDTLHRNGGDLIFTFEETVIKIADFTGFAEGLNVGATGDNIESRVANLMTKLLPASVLQQPDSHYFIHDMLAPIDDLSLIGTPDVQIGEGEVVYSIKNINTTDILLGVPNNKGNGYFITFAKDLTDLLDIN